MIFFCVDYNEMLLTHKFETNQFVPKTNAKKLYYTYQGWYLDRYSFEAVKAIATKQLEQTNKFLIKFGARHELDRAIMDLLEMQRVFSIPGILQRITHCVSKSGLVLEIANGR